MRHQTTDSPFKWGECGLQDRLMSTSAAVHSSMKSSCEELGRRLRDLKQPTNTRHTFWPAAVFVAWGTTLLQKLTVALLEKSGIEPVLQSGYMFCCVIYTYVESAYCGHHYSTLIHSLLQSFTLFQVAALGQVHLEGHSTLQGAEVMSQPSETGTQLYLENGSLRLNHHVIHMYRRSRAELGLHGVSDLSVRRRWVFTFVFLLPLWSGNTVPVSPGKGT
jgi:hypothetical protein